MLIVHAGSCVGGVQKLSTIQVLVNNCSRLRKMPRVLWQRAWSGAELRSRRGRAGLGEDVRRQHREFSLLSTSVSISINKTLPYNIRTVALPVSNNFALFTCTPIHAIWFKWDRLCGTISKFLAFMWDIWYQFYQMDGTVLGGAWWSGSVISKQNCLRPFLWSWIVLSNNWYE